MDDIAGFKAWATKLGCPPERISSDETLKKSFRGDQNSMFQHIMEKVRSRQEIASMRRNVLVRKLEMHQKMDNIVANSALQTLPPELQRYMKIQKLRKKIDETRHRIKQSAVGFDSFNLQIKEKNVQKLQVAVKLTELQDKSSLYVVHNTMLKSSLDKEAQLLQRIERIMPIKGSDACRTDTAEKAIEQCIQLLETFYENFKEANLDASRSLQDKLWSDIRDVLRGIPNHLLWNVLLAMKDRHLHEISQEGSRREVNEHGVTLSDHDLLQTSMAKLCTSHIMVFLDYVSSRNKLETARGDYLARYTPCASELEAKMSLLNVMDDEAEESLEEYLVQWNLREYNQGQIEHMGREIERKKEEVVQYMEKVQNHEQLLAQLRAIYGQIEDISKHMEGELQQVRQIKRKVHYSKYVCQHTVHTIRQKNGNNQTLNTSDQSFSRLETTVIGATGPTYSPAVLPPFVRELEIFRSIPLVKYTLRSKTLHFALEANAALAFETPSALALLPCTGVSANVFLRQCADMQELEKRAQIATNDGCAVIAPNIEHGLLEQRWQNNHGKLCEMLDEIETLTNGTRQLLSKVRTYYNFTLANSLRKYVPSTKLFNGRSFREYETEYLMYYRMIYGFGGH